jgi:hypothetical protein
LFTSASPASMSTPASLCRKGWGGDVVMVFRGFGVG